MYLIYTAPYFLVSETLFFLSLTINIAPWGSAGYLASVSPQSHAIDYKMNTKWIQNEYKT